MAQQRSSSERQKVLDVIGTFFAAAHDDDLAKFKSIVASGVYAFENGARFYGDSIMTLTRNLHSAGKHYERNVTEPDIHCSYTAPALPRPHQPSRSRNFAKVHLNVELPPTLSLSTNCKFHQGKP
jgi:hypothetical protein